MCAQFGKRIAAILLAVLLLSTAVIAVGAEASQLPTTESITAASRIDEENFTVTDRAVLERAKTEIETLLSVSSGNYTAVERDAMEAEIDRLDAVLYCIKRVEAVQKAIGMIPVGADMADEDVQAAVRLIEEAYAKLTAHERSQVDRSSLDALLGIVPPAEYAFVAGDGSLWQRGSDFALTFRANMRTDMVTGIVLDSTTLQLDKYMIGQDEVIVSLPARILQPLALGEHTLTLTCVDGEITCSFIIEAEPAGGSSSGWIVWLVLLLCLIVALPILAYVYRNWKNKRM